MRRIYVNYRCSKNSFLFLAIAPVVSLCLFISSCAAPTVEGPPGICRGKANISEAIQVLRGRRENIKPVRAGGSMSIRWYDGEEKTHRENLNIDLRFYPPDRLYLGGRSILGEVVRLGANADQFWVLMKPKEISTYQWGARSHVEMCQGKQWMNPQNFFEALGVLSVDANWLLSAEGDFDVLTRTDSRGNVVEKIYVNCSSYLAQRIEYYGAEGQVVLVLELNDYTQPADAAPVPTRIKITHLETNTAADITLKNVKLFEPSPKQLAGLFTRPEPKGFEHIFELNENCEFIQQ